MIDLIVIVVVGIILGSAILYIIRQKKRGVKCIGCPAGATCGKRHCDCQAEFNPRIYK